MSNLEKALNEVPKNTKTSAIEALHEIAESANKRSLILLFSDMFDSNTDLEALFAAMQHLRYRKHEVILFHVMDKQHETNFEYSNRPHIFIDLETGNKVRLNPAQIKEKVRENAATFLHALKLKCAQYKIDYIEADIHAGFKPVLLPFLLKRTKMM